MTLAEFIDEARHAFLAEGIDPDSPSAQAIINNLAMIVPIEGVADRFFERARRKQGDGSVVTDGPCPVVERVVG